MSWIYRHIFKRHHVLFLGRGKVVPGESPEHCFLVSRNSSSTVKNVLCSFCFVYTVVLLAYTGCTTRSVHMADLAAASFCSRLGHCGSVLISSLHNCDEVGRAPDTGAACRTVRAKCHCAVKSAIHVAIFVRFIDDRYIQLIFYTNKLLGLTLVWCVRCHCAKSLQGEAPRGSAVMARWMKYPLPPSPHLDPPPLVGKTRRTRKNRHYRQGTSHCSCLEHCFLFLRALEA